MLEINYNVTIPESETAFMLFWKKYCLRRTVMFSVVFAISVTLFVNMMLGGETMFMVGGIGAGLSAGFMASLWLKPFRIRKRLVAALEMMGEEKYTVSLNDDTIEIETISESEDETEKTEKSVYRISEEELFSKETQEMFILCVNKALFYVFPKRCMSQPQIEDLRTYFNKKRI